MANVTTSRYPLALNFNIGTLFMDVVEVLARVQVLLKGITQIKYFYTAKCRARKSWLWGLTISIKDILGLISIFARFWFPGSGGET